MPLEIVILLIIGILASSRSWGPGIHIRLASKLLEEREDRLQPDQADLLARYPHDFLYGNIAADIINFKKYGGVKNHCHNWNMRERIEELIDAEHEQAFLLGYMCHLAADVVAHNHYVPYHILFDLPPAVLGHTYWEARSDGIIQDPEWAVLEVLRSDKALHESDQVINRAVPTKALSLTTNKFIFNNILLARSRASWRKVINQMRLLRPRREIQRPHLDGCLTTAYELMVETFDRSGLERLRTFDPNGHHAIAESRRHRREVVRLAGRRSWAREEACAIAEAQFGRELLP